MQFSNSTRIALLFSSYQLPCFIVGKPFWIGYWSYSLLRVFFPFFLFRLYSDMCYSWISLKTQGKAAKLLVYWNLDRQSFNKIYLLKVFFFLISPIWPFLGLSALNIRQGRRLFTRRKQVVPPWIERRGCQNVSEGRRWAEPLPCRLLAKDYTADYASNDMNYLLPWKTSRSRVSYLGGYELSATNSNGSCARLSRLSWSSRDRLANSDMNSSSRVQLTCWLMTDILEITNEGGR